LPSTLSEGLGSNMTNEIQDAIQHLIHVFLDLDERRLVVIQGGSLSRNDFGLLPEESRVAGGVSVPSAAAFSP
jgi:hypothetical protein